MTLSTVPATGVPSGCPANSTRLEFGAREVERVVLAHRDLLEDHRAFGLDVGPLLNND